MKLARNYVAKFMKGARNNEKIYEFVASVRK